MSASKDELIADNQVLSAEVARLAAGLDEIQQILQKMEKTYVESKGTFSLSRYGKLKTMIKDATSEDVLKKAKSLSESEVTKVQDRKGMSGLLQKARQFAGEGEGASAVQKKTADDKKSGISGFFKKIKNITGFSEQQDLHCLDKEDIGRDNERKRREVTRLTSRGLKVYNRLEGLHRTYQASKAHAPPTRYQELKDMIKGVVAEPV